MREDYYSFLNGAVECCMATVLEDAVRLVRLRIFNLSVNLRPQFGASASMSSLYLQESDRSAKYAPVFCERRRAVAFASAATRSLRNNSSLSPSSAHQPLSRVMSDRSANNAPRGTSPGRRTLNSSSMEAKETTTTKTTAKTSSKSSESGASTLINKAVELTSTRTVTTSGSMQLTKCLRETILTIAFNGTRVGTVNLNLCKEKSIEVDGTLLVAWCRERESEAYQRVVLDLNSYIIFDSETNVIQTQELDFMLAGADKLVDSSRTMMDITLIFSFNLSKLLSEPGFRTAITEVAERAESDAHDQRLAAMSEMNEQVEEIKKEVEELREKLESVATKSQKASETMKEQLDSMNKESSLRFEREMTMLINAVAKEAMKAVYAQIREFNLQVLTVEQQKAYEVHWAPPPYMADDTPEAGA
ncbi:hypothetical protein C8R45DRAFT_929468 [Mycena sanguinolenta]|nr:hypothetical protein C8R45DRAFT_929468 [Mycena sanguinolenta]